MNEFQKIVKYLAIGFGLYLAISIISAIVGVVIGVSTGIYSFHHLMGKINTEKVDITKEYEQFSKIDIDLTSSNIKIESKGDVYKLEAYQISDTVKIEENNNTLTIKDTKRFNKSFNDSNITIYIPEGKDLENIDLDMGAGNIDIDYLNSKNVDFDFGAGSVNIKKLISDNAKIECGAGEVIIEKSDLKNADIDTGVGKLTYTGYLKGESKFDCGIGEVKINLNGGSELYSIDAEKGVGNITINGDPVSNNKITGNGPNKVKIDGGIGNIEIKME